MTISHQDRCEVADKVATLLLDRASVAPGTIVAEALMEVAMIIRRANDEVQRDRVQRRARVRS